MKELDTVEFLVPVEGLPAGTTAAVLEVWEESALVEVVAKDGSTAAMPTVPLDSIRVTVPWQPDEFAKASDNGSAPSTRPSPRSRSAGTLGDVLGRFGTQHGSAYSVLRWLKSR